MPMVENAICENFPVASVLMPEKPKHPARRIDLDKIKCTNVKGWAVVSY